MASRSDLHKKLVGILGSEHCYYQPPESLKMQYPCIRYKRIKIDTKKADNINYQKANKYEVIVISRSPDHKAIDSLLELPYCSHDGYYISDGLNHDAFTLYY